MISVDTINGIVADGRNTKMTQVTIADKHRVAQVTVNRIFKLHKVRVKVKIKQVFTFRSIIQSECGFRYELYENDVFLKYSRYHSTYEKALKSAKFKCYYWNKKVNANSDLLVDKEGGVDG